MLFVIDESSLSFIGLSNEDAAHAIEVLVDNLLQCREEGQRVMRCSDIWDYAVFENDIRLYQFLFENAGAPGIDRDLRVRFQRALDRCDMWDEVYDVLAVDVGIDGRIRFAPSIAFAHGRIHNNEAAGCLPLPGTVATGKLPVTVLDTTLPVPFIVSAAERREFYRDAIEIEDAGEEQYFAYGPLAFPELTFADGLQAQWRRFSRAYRDIRRDVTRHLAALNDHHREVFHGHPEPAECQTRMRGLGHVDMSPESPNTRANRTAWRMRAIRFDGRDLYCEWHLKITRTADRIHFHPGIAGVTRGPIVGIFAEHLPT